ncbi:MAG: HlyD family efflux transporter periplasmic adaptor subunit [Pseudomonadota bacterium]
MLIWKRLAVLPPVIVGLALVYWATSNRSQPELAEITERQTPVAFIEVQPQSFVPSVTSFGTVQPAHSWDAVAQVRGRIDYLHPNFVRGGVIRAGEDVVRIAADEYELAVAQAEANILSAAAQIEELKASAEATEASLAIEQQALELSERELARQQELAERGAVSSVVVEAQERSFLAQQASVQSLQNQLNLVPSQRSALEQSLAVSEASLNQANLDLERTRIEAPFDGRVAAADVDISEFVSSGTRMGTLDSVAAAEIEAQVAPQQMAQMSRLVGRQAGTEPGGLANQLRETLQARVRLVADGVDPEWAATVDRITDGVDPQTRAIGVFVTVADPYGAAQLGARPPLIKGMFVEVEIVGPAVDGIMVLPRSAIDQGRVMVVDPDVRLGFEDVDVLFTTDDIAVIAKGSLASGTEVIVSDPSPAIPGMALIPRRDADVEARLAAAVAAQSASETSGDSE